MTVSKTILFIYIALAVGLMQRSAAIAAVAMVTALLVVHWETLAGTAGLVSPWAERFGRRWFRRSSRGASARSPVVDGPNSNFVG